MTQNRIADELWKRIEPLLPQRKTNPAKGGRPRVSDRAALEGILFILRTGLPWHFLPRQFGCSGMTCWRRLRDWKKAGVWDELYQIVLDELQRRHKIRWTRAAIDSATIRALEGGEKTGKNPTDRGRRGTKHHVLVDGKGVPLAIRFTGANRHDVNEILPLLDGIPPIRGRRGRPRRRPKRLYGDRAYDSEAIRKELRRRRIKPYLAKRNTAHGSGLGKYRWVVERTISWLHSFRRLRLRYDRKADIHHAFLTLAATVICVRFLAS